LTKFDVQIRGVADVNKMLTEIGPREAKNLMRATTTQMARDIAKDAKARAPRDQGTLIKGIAHKRRRGNRNTLRASVVANKNGKSFYWLILEYGDGPDGVEHAFMRGALRRADGEMEQRYLRAFTDKLIARLVRLKKAAR